MASEALADAATAAPYQDRDDFLPVAEAAALMHISPRTLYRLVEGRRVTYYRPPGTNRVLIARSTAVQYVKQGRIRAR